MPIRASAPGFKASEQRDVALSVGAKVRINFSLEVVAVNETVSVEGVALVLKTESGEARGGVVHMFNHAQFERRVGQPHVRPDHVTGEAVF